MSFKWLYFWKCQQGCAGIWGGCCNGSVFSKIISGLDAEKASQLNSNANGKEKPFLFSPKQSALTVGIQPTVRRLVPLQMLILANEVLTVLSVIFWLMWLVWQLQWYPGHITIREVLSSPFHIPAGDSVPFVPSFAVQPCWEIGSPAVSQRWGCISTMAKVTLEHNWFLSYPDFKAIWDPSEAGEILLL